MKFEEWNLREGDAAAARTLEEAGFPYLVSQVLAARGIRDGAQAAAFLEREHSLTHSPFLMRDMDKAVRRIEEGIARNEHVAVFGDYDVDGITATVILVDYLRSRGVEVTHYIPRRIEDGYGLSADAMRGLHEKGVTLVVTVDCGITGVEEVDYAAELGMDVVVTDHHECKETLPRAAAVVDPHRPDCTYPFRQLAGCGVALKLVLALGGPEREEALFSRYCTLAAIGTVADVMEMTGENRTIVSRGLESIQRSDFVGLHALLREAGLTDKEITSVQIGFVLAPRINAAGRMGEADKAADLLLCDDPARAGELARELCELNRERQTVEQEIYAQALEMIETLPPQERSALVLADHSWHQGVVGIVASRLSEKFACPSFMIHISGHVGKGSCRSWNGFNLFAALEECSDLLLGFGGHELAAGFTIEEENIPAFRKRMNQCVERFRDGKAPVSTLEVDVTLRQPGRVTLWEVEQLQALEPYGTGNARPLFCLPGATLERAQNVGQNRHLKLRISKGAAQFEGIFFSATAEQCGCKVDSRVDAAFYLQINEFRGNRTVQMQLVDIRPSRQCSGKEEEALELVRRCVEGQTLTAREAGRMLPSRPQCAGAWRGLRAMAPEGRLEGVYLPLVRQLAQILPGTEQFLRAAFCLELFSERGLLSCKREGDRVILRLNGENKKVDLEESIYMTALRRAIQGKRGEGQ